MSIDQMTGRTINWQDPRGYVRLTAPGHQLAAGRDAVVARHRLVLWDDMHSDDPDPFTTFDPCCHCGYELPWRVDGQGRSTYRYTVNVDHLNDTPGDDRAENLVVACWWCNANRSWVVQDFGGKAWRRIAELHARTPPSHRPNLPGICEAFTGKLPSRYSVSPARNPFEDE